MIRASTDWSRLPQLTLMRTGVSGGKAISTIEVKLCVPLGTLPRVPRLIGTGETPPRRQDCQPAACARCNGNPPPGEHPGSSRAVCRGSLVPPWLPRHCFTVMRTKLGSRRASWATSLTWKNRRPYRYSSWTAQRRAGRPDHDRPIRTSRNIGGRPARKEVNPWSIKSFQLETATESLEDAPRSTGVPFRSNFT